MGSPDEVADWVRASIVTLAKDADADAAAKNNLIAHPDNVLRSLARKGASVYASVHATRDEVWDVCAEVVP